MQIEVESGELVEFVGDAVMVPTVSDGSMRWGVAAAIRQIVGIDVEHEVMSHAPIAVGAALVTVAPGMNVRHLIHAPLTETPGLRIGVENIRRATRAALLGAHRYELERIGIPGIGYGETGVPHDEAARAIIDEAIAFKRSHPTTIVLLDTDELMLEAFQDQVENG